MGQKEIVGLKMFWPQKKFKFEQILCPKILRVKTTWGPKKYWRKNI